VVAIVSGPIVFVAGLLIWLDSGQANGYTVASYGAGIAALGLWLIGLSQPLSRVLAEHADGSIGANADNPTRVGAVTRSKRTSWSSHLIVGGWILYGASLILPATFDNGAHLTGAVMGFGVAFDSNTYGLISLATNGAIVASLLATSRHSWQGPLGLVLIASGIYNLGWLFDLGPSWASSAERSSWSLGYWVWILSYLAIGIGLITSKQRTTAP
jgi:hypothetical protein